MRARARARRSSERGVEKAPIAADASSDRCCPSADCLVVTRACFYPSSRVCVSDLLALLSGCHFIPPGSDGTDSWTKEHLVLAFLISSALSSGGAMRNLVAELALTLWLFVEVSDVCHYRHYLSFDRQGECRVLYLIPYGQYLVVWRTYCNWSSSRLLVMRLGCVPIRFCSVLIKHSFAEVYKWIRGNRFTRGPPGKT